MGPEYDASRFPPFAVTVDLVVLTVRDGALAALLIRRGEEPFAGYVALPGGFVRSTESLDEAAARELTEETGLAQLPVHLEQLASYGAVDRDPRMRVVSTAYLALAPDLPTPRAGGDAVAAAWTPVAEALPVSCMGSGSEEAADGPGAPGPATDCALAFDHARILADGVERARAKLEYSPLAAAFCPPRFTVGELRRVYEAVWGVSLDPRNFHRKVTGTPGFLVPVGGTTARQGGRPAQLFERGTATLLNPPMLRPA
jgi:8-oxo-dGTP diphosphatase